MNTLRCRSTSRGRDIPRRQTLKQNFLSQTFREKKRRNTNTHMNRVGVQREASTGRTAARLCTSCRWGSQHTRPYAKHLPDHHGVSTNVFTRLNGFVREDMKLLDSNINSRKAFISQSHTGIQMSKAFQYYVKLYRIKCFNDTK